MVEISLKYIPKGAINNIPALVQIMAWRRSGDKPLSEPMMVDLPTHICVTRPQWPPKVLLLCRSWGACVPRRSQRLCQLEFWLLVGTTMLDRLWARGQTKCNTLLMLATSVFGRILLTTLLCDVLVEVQAGHLMAQWRGMHGSYLVPFVMLTPTILRGRVPSWLRWWLGV